MHFTELKKISSKKDGYTLLYTIFLMLIVSTFLLSFLLIIFYHNSLSERMEDKIKLKLKARSIIEEIISGRPENEIVQSSKKEGFNVSIENKRKGLFFLYKIKTHRLKDSSEVWYNLGALPNDEFDNAVVLSQLKSDLNVAGKTKIDGDILLSGKLKRGDVFGKLKTDKNFHTGRVVINDSIPLKLYDEKEIEELFVKDTLKTDSLYQMFESGDIVLEKYNFKDYLKDTSIYVNGDLTLEGELVSSKKGYLLEFFVKGNVIINEETDSNIRMIIKSDSEIKIEEEVKIKNAVLIADSNITLAEDSKFANVQIISKDTIDVKKSYFEYPSYIAVFDSKENPEENSFIKLNNSVFNGAVMLVSKSTQLNENSGKILLDDESQFKGVLYSESKLELNNKITGTVYVNQITHYRQPTEYLNWLFDFEINRTELDSNFVLPYGFNKKKKVVSEEWIY